MLDSTSPSNQEPSMKSVELAAQFFDAVEKGDGGTLERLCADDAVIWHNYDQLDAPFKRVMPALHKAAAVVKGLSYARRSYTALPDGALAQHSLTGTLPDGKLIDAPIIVRLYMRDGRIHRLEEYLDRMHVAALAAAVAAAG
jgi:ketosteroid isomerase-like protein